MVFGRMLQFLGNAIVSAVMPEYHISDPAVVSLVLVEMWVGVEGQSLWFGNTI